MKFTLTLFYFVCLIGVVACSSQSGSGLDKFSGAKPALPSQAENLEDYFEQVSDDSDDGIQLPSLFKQVVPGWESVADYFGSPGVSSGAVASNLKLQMVAECMQYNALYGITQLSQSQCFYHPNWTQVKTVLQTCSGANKKLVLDLKLNLTSTTETPLLIKDDAQPFPVLAACVTNNAGSAPTIEYLNPAWLQYEILTPTNNSYTKVEKIIENPGFFVGSFENYADQDLISSAISTIRLASLQSDGVQLPNPLPAVNVAVRPSYHVAAMPDFKMMVNLTDHRQAPLRHGTLFGPVNLASGEMNLSHRDVSYENDDTKDSFTITRTSRSFYTRVSDFGHGWQLSLAPTKGFYTFITPTGSQGNYEFLHSGEGRLLSFDVGPFWAPLDPTKPNLAQSKLFTGTENATFDLSGRLTRTYDKETGNAFHYLFSGSQLKLVFNQYAARNSSTVIQSVAAAFENACGQLGSGTLPQNISTVHNLIRGSVSPVAGKFLHFCRNPKGYVVAAIDQTGNFTFYTYGTRTQAANANGDLLRKVTFYVSHDPMNTGSYKQENIVRYQYEYAEVEDPQWSGLISKVDVPTQAGLLSNVTYEVNTSLFGGAPLVESFNVGPIQYEVAYDFDRTENFSDLGPIKAPRTTLSNTLQANSPSRFTFFEDRGFLIKAEGPTETSTQSIVYEARYDLPKLRLKSEIERGIESVFVWDDSGNLDKIISCADRDSNGNQIPANFSDADCAGPSRTTDITTATYFDYFYDLSASPIMLSYSQPGLNGETMTTTTLSPGCLGGPGVVQSVQKKSGFTCDLIADNAKGGNFLAPKGESSFEDGSAKTLLDPQAPLTAVSNVWGTGIFQSLSSTFLPYTNSSQIGNYQISPYLGISKRSNGSSLVPLVGERASFVDGYGRTLAELDFTNDQVGGDITNAGYVTRIFNWDYRDPLGARLTGLKESGGRMPRVASAAETVAGELSQAFVSMNPNGQDVYSNIALQNEFGSALFNVSSEEWLVDNRYDALLRLSRTLADDGSIQLYQYSATKPYLISGVEIRRIRACASGNSNCISTPSSATAGGSGIPQVVTQVTYAYDNFDRRIGTIFEDGISEVIIFRTENDYGVQKMLINEAAVGGIVSTTEVKEFDWAGRPLRTEVQEEGQPLKVLLYEYSPFGEVIKTTTQSGDYSFVEEKDLDLLTGVTLNTSEYALGDNKVDTEIYVTEFQEFDDYLRPSIIRDVNRNIKTQIQGIRDKNLNVRVYAPTTYRGSDSVLQSEVNQNFDGCGNLIVNQKKAGSTYLITTASVENVFCGVSQSSGPSSSGTGTTTTYDYSYGGDLLLEDETSTGGIRWEHGLRYFLGHTQCAKAPSGKCVSPALQYSMRYTAAPAIGVVSEPLSLIAAEVAHANDLSVLLKKSFYGTSLEAEYAEVGATDIFQIKQFAPESVAGDSNYKFMNARNYAFHSNLGGDENKSEDVSMHPSFGSVTERTVTRTHPRSNAVDSAQENYFIDPNLGLELASTLKVNNNSISSSITTNWFKGLPKTQTIERLAGGYPGQSGSFTVNHQVDTTSYSGELPTASVSSSGESIGASILAYDGLGRPSTVTYSQAASPTHDNLNLVSTLSNIQHDTASRLKEQTLTLQDSLPAGATASYSIPGQSSNFSRAILGASNNSMKVKYLYEGSNLIFEIYPNAAQTAKFTVTYSLMDGQITGLDGKIRAMTVQTPNGESINYDPFGVSFEMPYRGHVDDGAGRFTGDNLAAFFMMIPFVGETIFNWVTEGEQSSFNLSNHEYPHFNYSLAVPDNSYRNYSLKFQEGTSSLEAIFNSNGITMDPGNLVYSSGPVNDPAQYIPTSRVALANSSAIVKNKSCDNLYWRDTADYTHSRLEVPEDASGSNLTLFNEFGKLAVAQRGHFVLDTNGDIQKRWKMTVKNQYDLNGLRAGSEEKIAFMDSSAGSAFPSYTDVRVIERRYFNADFPAPESLGSISRFAFKEVIVDSKNAQSYCGGFTCGGNFDFNFAQADDLTGTYIHIPGPNGPLMTFRQVGSSWLRIDHIYDNLGNIKNSYAYVPEGSGLRVPPKFNEAYYPHGGSVVATFDGPITNVQEFPGSLPSAYQTQTQSSGFGNELSNNYSIWAAPEIQPRPAPFGYLGYRRDILGFYYVPGSDVVYDPFHGDTIESKKVGDEICVASNSPIIERAKGIMQYQRLMKAKDVDTFNAENFSPSILMEQGVYNSLESFAQGTSGWSSCQLLDPMGLLGLRSKGEISELAAQCHLGSISSEWYFDRNVKSWATTASTVSANLLAIPSAYAGFVRGASLFSSAGGRFAGGVIGAGVYSTMPTNASDFATMAIILGVLNAAEDE